MVHRSLASWLAFLALGTMVGAQGGRPPVDIMGVEPFEFGEPVLSAPFSAEAVTETTQELRDGNRIERSSTTTIARDSMGRVRREQALPPIGPAGVDPEVRMITINDPRQRILYFIDTGRRTVSRSPAPSGSPRPPGGQGRGGRSMPAPQISSESLGIRQIAGVRAEGTRQTMTIPAGVFGNIRPIEVVTDRWYSTDLKIVVESRRTDPLMGDVVYRVTSLVRAEPASELFEVPPGFTVVERPARPGRP